MAYKKLTSRSLSKSFCCHVGIFRSFFSIKKDNASSTSRGYSTSKTVLIPTTKYKLHNLTEDPPKDGEVTSEKARKWLSEMFVIRQLENTAAKFYKQQLTRGFCHLYAGEEAVAVGLHSLIEKDDAIITSYRCHAWVYLCGVPLHRILAELCGKETGIVRGKGGSVHMFTRNFYGGNGIVGAQVPLGTGVALKMKYLKQDAIMFAIYGDGAANQGQIFEAFNMAMLWKLPIIFVCENNQYAMGTSIGRSTVSGNYYKRGDYIPGILVDGMNIVTVREGTKFARNHVKSGKGPIIMEMNTYRYYGHSMSDPGVSYRSREEVKKVRSTKDPINKFMKIIIEYGLLTEDEMKQVENDAKKLVGNAAKQALNDQAAKMEELTYDVYLNAIEVDIRGLDPWSTKKHKNIGKPF